MHAILSSIRKISNVPLHPAWMWITFRLAYPHCRGYPPIHHSVAIWVIRSTVSAIHCLYISKVQYYMQFQASTGDSWNISFVDKRGTTMFHYHSTNRLRQKYKHSFSLKQKIKAQNLSCSITHMLHLKNKSTLLAFFVSHSFYWWIFHYMNVQFIQLTPAEVLLFPIS